MPSVSGVAASGIPDVDGLLSGVRWTSGDITFSFPTSASQYVSNYSGDDEPDTFGVLNSAQQNAVRAILVMFSAVADLTFAEMTETVKEHATLRYSLSDAPSTAWAYYPNDSARGTGGDTWINKSDGIYDNPTFGTYAWMTLVHETGHALGLKHGHEDDGGFPPLPAAHDSLEYSVMTYRAYVGDDLSAGGYAVYWGGYPQTPMMDDIAALQYIYGPNFETNSADTIYAWSPTTGQMKINGVAQATPAANRILMTVWDGGGTDTYDLSGYTTNLKVDLDPGAWTTTASAQLSRLDYYTSNTHIAAGNIANALLFEGDLRSLIENAWGGSGNDTMRGNVGANVLVGGAGVDTLDGRGGNDTLIGQQGADNLTGGDGADMLFGYEDADMLEGGAGDDFLSGGDGNDTLRGGDGNDGVHGEEGNDTLEGGAGDDVLVGYAGADTLHGDEGHDTLIGGDGNDTLRGGDGDDQVFAYAGADVLYGGAGGDFLAGGGGVDTLYGDAGNDVLDGEADADQILGGAGGDNINGNEGNDSLLGEAGNDGLLGGAGNDVLNGGPGNDYLIGGAGSDLFVFEDGSGNDLVVDFEAGAAATDVLDLRAFHFADFAAVLVASVDVDNSQDPVSKLGLYLRLDADDAIFLRNVTEASLAPNDFLLA